MKTFLKATFSSLHLYNHDSLCIYSVHSGRGVEGHEWIFYLESWYSQFFSPEYNIIEKLQEDITKETWDKDIGCQKDIKIFYIDKIIMI